jgi:hypothetical protein
MYNKLSHSVKHFLKNLNASERKMLRIIVASFLVLILGGIILFFTKDTGSEEKTAVEFTCRDSDGYDIRTKGAVTYTDTKGRHVDEDSCDLTEKAVYEMTCHKTSFWSFSSLPEKKTVACPKGCINGACTK